MNELVIDLLLHCEVIMHILKLAYAKHESLLYADKAFKICLGCTRMG